MQKRHTDRKSYFDELSLTSEHHFLPYIEQFAPVDNRRVLEIGCGEGGNLAPFARRGCSVTGIDISENRIREAHRFFGEEALEGTFIARDIFSMPDAARQKSHSDGQSPSAEEQFVSLEQPFDIILIHDVIEHITDKYKLLNYTRRFLAPDGVLFVSFPAWQMPFGGHQQICRNKIVSHLPFIHLLPTPLYRGLLRMAGESDPRIDELLDISRCRTSIEQFERLVSSTHYQLVHKRFWFINPHYKQKFGISPRRLWKAIGAMHHLRNYFCTSCFYLLKTDPSKNI
ncbi:MAG: class I SAM-dependent methyltransferase [Prevotellaceae bacterium]|jgi:2-polyprenyl-3-methyl-5-hydroxy-6-metoxy-1,4-benzoquinol methylase|nr:class I SAM-dependent methyltransferase [Prevotellaceae bacterium]